MPFVSQTPSDEALVLAIRQGDAEAFRALYKRYNRKLFGYIRRYVSQRERAEDLLQEVFVTVLEDRGLDPRHGKVAPWLFTVARNRALNVLRDTRRATRGDERWQADEGLGEGSPEEMTARGQELSLAQRELHALPRGQRDALLLRHLGDLSYREISELTAVPEGTVKSRIHHALRTLQRRLSSVRSES